MGGTASGLKSTFSVLPEAPRPVSAQIVPSFATYTVTFDGPLLPGPVLGTQFDAFVGLAKWNGVLANAAGNVLTGTIASPGPDLSPPRVVFTNTANDFKGLNGLQIADFSQPATVV